MPELEEPEVQAIKKSDLLPIKTIDDLAELLFPESKGFKRKAKRGPQNEIIIIVDDFGNELHLHQVDAKPKKSDHTNRGEWSRNEKYKFYFQPGQHLLILGKDSDLSGEIVFRHTRAEWTKDGLTRSFVDTLKLLEYGKLAVFDELLERKEVTEKFYEEWIEQVRAVTKAVTGVPEERRSEIGRLVTQRLLFLHFIQTKLLLDNNPHFMLDYARKQETDVYGAFKRIFFDCLNREGQRKMNLDIPYLNGGLFRETDLELEHPKYTIQDQPFRDFLQFLGGGRWNWHLDEHAESESEKADTLDPALLGHIFEKSVNQKEMGAFYTPSSITRYMSEQGIWGYLGSKLDPRAKPNDLANRIKNTPKPQLWKWAQEDLARITVMDNACGSGAFLLAGLDVLRGVWRLVRLTLGESYQKDIAKLLSEAGGHQISFEYNLTKWLVARNIYGVDLEPGAVEIARLRLWLALITHAPNNVAGIEPLPNIDYNLRCGNSLMGFTKPQGTLAILDIDCMDLLAKVDKTKLQKSAFNSWKKGSLLNHALKLRGDIVNAYRFENHAKEARELRRVIETFDERVGGHIEQLWEGMLERKLNDKKGNENATREWLKEYRRLRDDTIRPFHWYLEFPDMMQQGGACVIITNPPWQKVRAEKREFHKQWWPEITNENKYLGANIDQHYEELYTEFPDARVKWDAFAAFYKLLQAFFKSGRFFEHQDKGDPDLFKLFMEHYLTVLKPDGWLVAIVNGGIYTADGCKGLRKLYWAKTRWHEMLGFENRWPIFEGVDSRFKVAICIVQNGGPTQSVASFFMRHAPDAPYEQGRINLTRPVLEELSGDSLRFPEVQDEGELRILQKANRWPVFKPENGWPIDWMRESDAGNDKHLFTDKDTGYPLYEGYAFHQFDANFEPFSQFVRPDEWRQHIRSKTGGTKQELARLAFRAIARNTDERTVIVARLPPNTASQHSAWVERVDALPSEYREVLLGVMNSLAFDYLARRSVTANVTKEIMQAIQIPPPEAFKPIWKEILQLVKTLEANGGTYGRERARLDAVVAQTYGLDIPDIDLIWRDFRVLALANDRYGELVKQEFASLPTPTASKAKRSTL